MLLKTTNVPFAQRHCSVSSGDECLLEQVSFVTRGPASHIIHTRHRRRHGVQGVLAPPGKHALLWWMPAPHSGSRVTASPTASRNLLQIPVHIWAGENWRWPPSQLIRDIKTFAQYLRFPRPASQLFTHLTTSDFARRGLFLSQTVP
jgi:hypothetical protein